ncbi:SDR family NAD(P)-dependent oxidoreductase [candidate division KSB1 bacterium]|nr:SDR family NAD(P)-dependent oxidoreductase [candidate division KSB1 bacterium]
MKPFQDKVAIVTGGASGMGRTICVYLAKHGSRVAIADCNPDGARETKSLITSNGGRARSVRVDVADPQNVESMIKNTMEEYGQIDFLFNNAGIGIDGEFQDMTLEHWQQLLDVSLWGVVYGCHYAYPIMMKQGSGHIIKKRCIPCRPHARRAHDGL